VDGALAHAGQAGETDVAVLAVDQPIVDLVREHDQVMLLRNLRDLLQALTAEHRAGGVVGIADQQRLAGRGDGRLDLDAGDLEIVGELGGDGYRRAAGKDHLSRVGHKAGLRHDHLVARVQQRGQRQIERLADAHRHQDLVLRIVVDPVERLQLLADGPAQINGAGIRGVAGLAALQAGDAGLQDHIGGDEIRLADAQADHVVHGGGDVEELADAGWRHRGYAFGNTVLHGSVSCWQLGDLSHGQFVNLLLHP